MPHTNEKMREGWRKIGETLDFEHWSLDGDVYIEVPKGIISDLKKSHKYKIWSNEHNAWWRPQQCGYTDHIELAGVYEEDEAYKIVEGANKYIEWAHYPNEKVPVPNETLVPVTE